MRWLLFITHRRNLVQKRWRFDKGPRRREPALEATSGERALMILHGGRVVDLLITDIRLDGVMTGWELARKCREADDELPGIYVSANPLEDAKCVDGGVFLNKPCIMERLLAACSTLATK